jgi:hypothetical protein
MGEELETVNIMTTLLRSFALNGSRKKGGSLKGNRIQ